MGLLLGVINVWLGLLIISVFIPVFVELDAELDIIRIILESIAHLFTW